MEEVPLLAQLASEYSRTAIVIGISIDDRVEQTDRTIKEKKMTWPVLADPRGFDAPVPIAYHVQGTPDIFVIDADGRIFKRLGTAKEIESALQALGLPGDRK